MSFSEVNAVVGSAVTDAFRSKNNKSTCLEPITTLQAAPTGESDMPCWAGFLAYEYDCARKGVNARILDTYAFSGNHSAAHRNTSGHDSCFAEHFNDIPISRELEPAAREEMHEQERTRIDEIRSEAPLPNMSREEYLRKVERIKEYIAAGDVYQVNLTMRWAVKTTATPRQIYDRLCAINPAPYGALLEYDDFAIISASPELFLDVRNGRVITRPIKGTRPRTGDPVKDAAARRELETSEKERAELNMIVDLMRNDLGRVCEYGTVRVTDPGSIEEHPTVFHRVATIEGQLAKGKTNLDLLRATFPPGSVTGAPKIRAMQIIRELEPTPRGVYCGCIGWIGTDGSMCMNVAIRTMVQVRDIVYVYAGSGIVADSDPEAEYAETLLKAKAMFRALKCDGD